VKVKPLSFKGTTPRKGSPNKEPVASPDSNLFGKISQVRARLNGGQQPLLNATRKVKFKKEDVRT